LEAAVKNLNWAITHVKRAHEKIQARRLRNERTLQKLKYPSEMKPVIKLRNRNLAAEKKCQLAIDYALTSINFIREVIKEVGITRKKALVKDALRLREGRAE